MKRVIEKNTWGAKISMCYLLAMHEMQAFDNLEKNEFSLFCALICTYIVFYKFC